MSGFSAAARVAGVVGRPIALSLSPAIHNAWIAAAGLDAVYVPLAPEDEAGFDRLVRACRGGLLAGLNVTAPFKERALALADDPDPVALRAGSANLLLFHSDGACEARSTDGHGLIAGFADQAPGHDLASGPAVILGAGGAARAAASSRAEELVFHLKGPTHAFALAEVARAFDGAWTLVNAAVGGPVPPLDGLAAGAAVMDMNYRPLRTGLLRAAEAAGHPTVDGLSMLIGQAQPSFEALFGQAPPDIDVRAVALKAMERPA